MIISRTPYRVSFAGGGTDLPAFCRHQFGAVLSTTLERHMYVNVHPRFEPSFRVAYSEIEIASDWTEIRHDLVREALRTVGLTEPLEITTIGDVPAGTGMGSSSSLTVGLVAALLTHAGQPIDPRRLAEEACRIELDRLQKPIGRQDQYAAAFGGLNYFRFNPDGSVDVEPVSCTPVVRADLERHMLLVATGQSRSADDILRRQSLSTPAYRHVLGRMRDLAARMRDCLTERNPWESFAACLHEGWELKRSLGCGISSGPVDALYQSARAAGAWGGKLLGAGGGGFLLVMAPPERHPAIRAALGHPRELNFRLGEQGSQIIFPAPHNLSRCVDAPPKALLVAAGLGTRLRPLTDSLPKCLVPVAGRTLLEHWVDALVLAGIRTARINTHAHADQVRAAIARIQRFGSLDLTESHEPELLGSAGTIAANLRLADDVRDVVLVYADNLSDVDLRSLVAFHRGHPDPITMLLFHAPNPSACGIAAMDERGVITAFVEKPSAPSSDLASAGIFVVDADAYRAIAAQRRFDLSRDVLPQFVGRMRGYVWEGYHRDIGTPEALARACEEFPRLKEHPPPMTSLSRETSQTKPQPATCVAPIDASILSLAASSNEQGSTMNPKKSEPEQSAGAADSIALVEDRTQPAALSPLCKSEADPRSRLTSVIIPCFNQVEFTQLCLSSLFRHTRSPWELIVIDNGSTDATAEHLRTVRETSPVPMEVITNSTNLGFPAACNQGLRVAQGDYLVLLNNDVVVTDAWLDQLIALADADPAHGMVGPMSNYATPPQLVDRVPYSDLAEMPRFAERWRRDHRGQWLTVEKLSGFCLLMKRAVFAGVGGLDEDFGLGMFDDDDFSLRARKAGFTLAVARDLFVHHFGSRSFVGAGIDTESLLNANQKRFAAKWGDKAVRNQRRVTIAPWASACAAPVAATRPKVSLTMIVRNEEANLPACLASAAGLFDEVVVVDTGSTDRTIEIARSFGARVFDFPWVDDFAAARNAALARATGDYAFWLDADDVLDPPEQARLRALFAKLRPHDDAAYVVRCSCDPDQNGGGGQTVVDHVRLFPVRENVRWTYRVHEQILPALRRADIPVRWSDVTVRHTGYTDISLRRRKLLRDEAILLEELADHPADPFALFNLGSIALEREDWRGALERLRASLAGSAPTDSITLKLYALIARCHQMLAEPDLAIAACHAGLAINAEDAELLFREAVIRRNTGDPAGAESCWRRVLTLKRPERFSSVDQGIYSHLTRRNLAALAHDRGDLEEARSLWTEVLTECPGDPDAQGALARLAVLASTPPDPSAIAWLVPGSHREVVPAGGPGDFDPYMALATEWVVALNAKVVVELGVRLGASARALLAGAHAVDGQVWGVDLWDGHRIDDPRFHFLLADAAHVAGRWEAIDLLHIDTDPHTEAQTLLWFALYASKCRAIALHDTHHPKFGVGAAVRAFTAAGGWQVYEYWGNPSGWTVLTRPGLPSPVTPSPRKEVQS